MKTIGEAAYEKWRELIDRPRVPASVLPVVQPWDRLKPSVRDTWEAVARAAVEQHEATIGAERRAMIAELHGKQRA